MEKAHTIEDFYRHKLEWMPANLQKEIGHFNVFRLGDFTGPCARPMPYNRKDFYKISLIVGENKIHYADKTVRIEKTLYFSEALIFHTIGNRSTSSSRAFSAFSRKVF